MANTRHGRRQQSRNIEVVGLTMGASQCGRCRHLGGGTPIEPGLDVSWAPRPHDPQRHRNPDFSQVETDRRSLTSNSFALFYQEKRPFFLGATTSPPSSCSPARSPTRFRAAHHRAHGSSATTPWRATPAPGAGARVLGSASSAGQPANVAVGRYHTTSTTPASA
jgi:hypothetical protein